ncbi:MAG: phosphoribosylamine--glycine ligase, partial [Nitrospirota bacterium]
VFCAPGNAGISRIAECINIKADSLEDLLEFAKYEGIDLTVVGPEVPLTSGIVDLFQKEGLRIFGPTQSAAELEDSKAFSKNLMRKYGIPTAEYKTFSSFLEAENYIRLKGAPIVVKADGLAAGKGVIIAETVHDAIDAVRMIMKDKVFGQAGNKAVIEECLKGEEASFLAFTDGETVIPMASAQDHKRIYDGDKGPNTGGMGAYSPAPVITEDLERKIMDRIMIPTIRAMKMEGRKYKGVLYAGLMIDKGEPKVLEFNVRFGDPETQPILMRLDNEIVDIFNAVIDGELKGKELRWKKDASVCVVLASEGYPGPYKKGEVIAGLEEAEGMDGVVVFHAGTTVKNGNILTDGGRVLGVTGLDKDIKSAIDKTYRAVNKINFNGMQYRKDIGLKAIER